MTRNTIAALFAVSALTLTASLAPTFVHAQRQQIIAPAGSFWNKRVNLSLKNADVRETIALIMKDSGTSYVIDKSVQGTVNGTLDSVPADEALTFVTRQVNASASLHEGVIQIEPIQSRQPGQPSFQSFDTYNPPQTTTYSVPIPSPSVAPAMAAPTPPLAPGSRASASPVVVQDSANLYVIRGNEILKVRKSDLKVISRGRLNP